MSKTKEISSVVNLGGRPTLYDPKYCHLAVREGKKGKSLAQIASKIGVSRPTLYNWMKEHAEFYEAVEMAKIHSQAFWEDLHAEVSMGRMDISGPAVTAMHKAMGARFPEDYNPSMHITKNETIELKGSAILTLKDKIERIASRQDEILELEPIKGVDTEDESC